MGVAVEGCVVTKIYSRGIDHHPAYYSLGRRRQGELPWKGGK